jgi:hypothetical protein
VNEEAIARAEPEKKKCPSTPGGFETELRGQLLVYAKVLIDLVKMYK